MRIIFMPDKRDGDKILPILLHFLSVMQEERIKVRRKEGKYILTVVRFVFLPEKPVVAHRRLRDESAFRSAKLPPQGEQGRTFSVVRRQIDDDATDYNE